MAQDNTIARSLHDLGLAGWFGGSLMGAIGLNGASREVDDPTDRARVANAGWQRWTPVNGAAIGAHLLGGAQLVRGNKGRLALQPQARWVNLTKAALTVAALGVTAYSRWQGQRVIDAASNAPQPVEDATTPAPSTAADAAGAQGQLRGLQWVVPAATGALIVLNAKAGEQQRPGAILRGMVRTNVPVKARAAAAVATRVTPSIPWARVFSVGIGLIALRRLLSRRERRSSGRRARDIMTGDVVTVSADDSLQAAAQRMVDHDIGSVPVCSNGRVLAMLTDRDIVTRAAAPGADLATVTAGDIADRRLVTVTPDASLRHVVDAMASSRVRRVPVVEDDHLVGIISQADVALTGADDVTADLVQLVSTAS